MLGGKYQILRKNMVLNVNSKQNKAIPIPLIANNDDQQITDMPRQKKLFLISHLMIYLKSTVQQGKSSLNLMVLFQQ